MRVLTIHPLALVSALTLHALLLTVPVRNPPQTSEPVNRVAIRLVAPREPEPQLIAEPAVVSRPVIDNKIHNQTRSAPPPVKTSARPPTPVAPAAQPVANATTPALPTPKNVEPLPTPPPLTVPAESEMLSAAPEPAPLPPADAATRPLPEAPAAAPNRLPELLTAVRQQVENHKDYPAFARHARQQGTAIVRVAIDAAGQLQEAVIVSSSGHARLDKAALAAVRNAGRFRPPDEFGLTAVTVEIPITYKLN
jgi:protein TonB